MEPLSYRHWICEGLQRSTSANRAALSACALGTLSHTSCFQIDCTLTGLSLRQLSMPSKLYRRQEHFRWQNLGQALGVLVRVGCTPCGASTPRLSTSSSLRRLTGLLREKLHLRAGFTLRCFQRLSFPDAATQLHGWRHDWYTVGPSTPVLSY